MGKTVMIDVFSMLFNLHNTINKSRIFMNVHLFYYTLFENGNLETALIVLYVGLSVEIISMILYIN